MGKAGDMFLKYKGIGPTSAVDIASFILPTTLSPLAEVLHVNALGCSHKEKNFFLDYPLCICYARLDSRSGKNM